MTGKDTDQASAHAFAEFQRRWEIESDRKGVALNRLWRLADHDPTVRSFIQAWRAGTFPSFEEMVCQLAVQLAAEKAEYMKTATKLAQLGPPPSVIVKECTCAKPSYESSPGCPVHRPSGE